MDVKPVAVLKRKSSSRKTQFQLCLFCQAKKSDKFREPSKDAKEKVVDSLQKRRKWRDLSNLDLLDRLEQVSEEQWKSDQIKWHKSCYSSFCSATNISRIEKRCMDNVQEIHPTEEIAEPSTSTSRRASTCPMDLEKCIFCQTRDAKQVLHSVNYLEKSEAIISASETDPIMRVRLSGVNDLIAAEGKYHLKCLVHFERNIKKQSKNVSGVSETDMVMGHLKSELEKGLTKGHVYDMGVVWDKYVAMSNQLDSEIPQRYMNRRKWFYVDVEDRLGGKANFVRPLDFRASLLMYPGASSDYVVSHSLSKGVKCELFASSGSESSEDSSSDESPHIHHVDTNIMQEMLHVALRLRSDLETSPGHEFSWQNIEQKHVEKVIPDSLYLFLILLFGGTTALETYDEESDTDSATEQKVCSIAQDIVLVCLMEKVDSEAYWSGSNFASGN